MIDIAVTIPRETWPAFIAHSTAATATRTYDFYGERPPLHAGDWIYFVSHRRVRCALMVERTVQRGPVMKAMGLFRPAITIAEEVRGFQGWRPAWFSMREVIEFPEWRTKGVVTGNLAPLAHGKTASEQGGSSA